VCAVCGNDYKKSRVDSEMDYWKIRQATTGLSNMVYEVRIYCHVCELLQTEFGLVIGFFEHRS
jgi:hypothetical protein